VDRAAPPARVDPPAGEPKTELWLRVKEAILSLPVYFSAPEIRIAGVRATEIFTLAAALEAAVEEQVVATLNRMRQVWDPTDRFPLLTFVRQPQTFPDVLLRYPAGGEIMLGIELKGWYLLAKEGEPTFRYKETPAVCTPWDLLIVVLWYLSDVISGSPRLLTPFIESARYAAEYRNYWWREVRDTEDSREIRSPVDVTPYPQKSDRILDHAETDPGGNFGIIARTEIIDPYVKQMLGEQIAGIPARYWMGFFSIFKESPDSAEIVSALDRMGRRAGRGKESKLQALAKDLVARVVSALRNHEG